MPLVTRRANQGNLFKQDTEPPEWLDGDLWSDNLTNELFLNIGGTATAIGILNQDSVIDFNGIDIPIGITI